MVKPTAQQKRTTIILLTTLALVGVGIWVWKDFLEDRIIPKRWGVVEPGFIYRSGQVDRHLIGKLLKENHIKVIIAMTGPVPDDPDQGAEEQAAKELGIELNRFPLRGDGTGDIHQYAQALTALVEARKAGRPALVHCAAGTQRTGGVIACYRLLFQHKDPQTVYRELRQYDWHDTSQAPLVPYLNQHMSELVDLLQQMGTLNARPQPLPQLYSRFLSNSRN